VKDKNALDGWRKSSFSGGNSDNCVEVKDLGGAKALRDTEDPDGAILTIQTGSWDAFIAGVKAGEFD
jgi:Domain of unknown function (DUF397)